MKYRILYTCICLLSAFLIVALPVTANQTILGSPPILKTYVASSPSDDERFFAKVTEFMAQLSGQPLPLSDELFFFTLLASGYNIENHNTAQQLINFLFYSAKAGEHYQQYEMNKGRYFTAINPEAESAIAQEYRLLAEKVFQSCDSCQEYYPDFVMYVLPDMKSEESESPYKFTGRLGF